MCFLRSSLAIAASISLAGVAPAAEIPDTLKHALYSPGTGPQGENHQGSCVAIDGNIAVVGVPFEDTTATDTGVVKVYNATTGALLHVLSKPSPAEGDFFGSTVAISGSRIVVGAPQDDTGSNGAGRVFIYDLSSATPTTPVFILPNPTPAFGDQFGTAVAISGARVVVGEDEAFGPGSAYIYDLSGATPTIPVTSLSNPSPASLDHFGKAVAVSGSLAVIGAEGDDTGAMDSGSAYVYDLAGSTPATPIATLANPSPFASAAFGSAVAVSGSRVVVGAYGDGPAIPKGGIAYVYDVSGPSPSTPVLTLPNPTPQGFDGFGISVSISGPRVLVGAYQDNTGALSTGSAYIFDVTSATPTVPVLTINNPTPDFQDFFGNAVAISGTRAVVGAPFDATAAPQAGIAYTYDLAAATPAVPVATLNALSPPAVDEFGYSVAVSGTLMLVGALTDDTAAPNAGSATLYDLAAGAPDTPVLTFYSPVAQSSALFGNAVALSGRFAAVASSTEGQGSLPSHTGTVYVYDLRGSTPTVPILALHKPSPTFADEFGNAIAMSGTRIVVGTRWDDTGATDAGSAYVFDIAGPAPEVPIAILHNPTPVASDYFGASVAISGSRVIVGAYQDGTGAANAGSAYVYDLDSPTPGTPVLTINNPAPGISDYFGWSVAISGSRVVVGADQDDTGASNAGTVYVYDLAGANPATPTLTLPNPTPAASELFGNAVAISGTRIVVGAWQESTGAIDAGSAYVFDLTSSTPSIPVAVLNNPTPAANDFFGNAVAIDHTTVLVGAYQASDAGNDRGAAYVYQPFDDDIDGDGLLDLWEYARFGSTSAHSALDDADNDGRKELLEQAFDTDPLVPDAALNPAVVNEGGFLTLTIPKRAGISYTVQSSATPDSAGFSSATTTVLLDNATTLKARDNTPIGTAPKRFLRIQVTPSP